MFLRSESESEREQGLGERTRPFRISRTEHSWTMDVKGNHCHALLTKSWTDGELGTASLLLGFHELGGSCQWPKIKPAR